MTDIGKPQRIIEVQPEEIPTPAPTPEPVPERTEPQPVKTG